MQSQNENGYFRTHSQVDKSTLKDGEKRIPLQTLKNNSDNNIQINNCKKEPESPIIKDARHMTVRNTTENEHEKNIPTIVISDDDEQPSGSSANPSISQRVIPGDGAVLEKKVVAKVYIIKKNLKRPRESQSATAMRDEYQKAIKILRLEGIHDRMNPPDEASKRGTGILLNEFSTDVFEHLISAERKIDDMPRVADGTRARTINWLIKINGPNGNPATLQTACLYLDNLLSSYSVVLTKLDVVATACFWISQKMHGPVYSAALIVKLVEYAFTVDDLVDCETCVLQRLNYLCIKVIPHDFITYFALCCDKDNPGEIEVAASFIVQAGLLVKPKLACEFPSVIAAAAVKNAVLLLEKKSMMTNLLVNVTFRQAADKSTCFIGVCTAQRAAIRIVACPAYRYRSCFEHYNVPPFYIAQKLAEAAN